MLEQAKHLSRDERIELVADLLELDESPLPALTREERDRQIAESQGQVARGEVIDEADMIDERHAGCARSPSSDPRGRIIRRTVTTGQHGHI